MRDFNGNAEKSNAARAAYDLEIEAIDRDLNFDLQTVIRFLASEGGEIGDHAASLLRHAWRDFEWRSRYAQQILRGRR